MGNDSSKRSSVNHDPLHAHGRSSLTNAAVTASVLDATGGGGDDFDAFEPIAAAAPAPAAATTAATAAANARRARSSVSPPSLLQTGVPTAVAAAASAAVASSSSSVSPLSPTATKRPWWSADGTELHLPPLLETLNLSSQSMGLRETRAIIKALQAQKSVTSLNLASNKIGDAGMEALAALLQRDALLVHLDASANNITDRGVMHLARAIASNPNLALVDLRLAFNRLTDSSCSALAQCVKDNHCLLSVQCTGNKDITPNGQHMLQALRSRPALVAAGKVEAQLLMPPERVGEEKYSESVQLGAMNERRRNSSAHSSPAQPVSRLSLHQGSRSAYTSPTAPAIAPAAASSMASRPTSELHVAPGNFSAPSSPRGILEGEDEVGGASLYASPRNRKAAAKQNELSTHERRVEAALDAQLAVLRQRKPEAVSSALLEQVFALLKEDDQQMSRFVELSVAFRQGSIPVSSFYSYALESLRFSGLLQVIGSMIVALHATPAKALQLRKAHIEYASVKALLKEKQQAQARGETSLGGQPLAEESSLEQDGHSALDVLRSSSSSHDDEQEAADIPAIPVFAAFVPKQQHAPPLFPVEPAPVAAVAAAAPIAVVTAPALSAATTAAPRAAASDAVAPSSTASAAAVTAAVPVTAAPPATVAPPAPEEPIPDTSVQYRFMQDKLARAEAAAKAKLAAEAKEAARVQAAAEKKAAEAARQAQEERKRAEYAAQKRAAEAQKAAAAEAERFRIQAEKLERARLEREQRERAEAEDRERAELFAAQRVEQARQQAEMEAARAAEEEKERAARRVRRAAEEELARQIEAQQRAEELVAAEAEAAARKRAKREAREAAAREAEEAVRVVSPEEAQTARKARRRESIDAASDAAAAAAAADAAAAAARISLMEELEGPGAGAGGGTDSAPAAAEEREKEAKKKRKEEKRQKKAAKEKEKEKEKQQQQHTGPVPPPPTIFHVPPAPVHPAGPQSSSSSSPPVSSSGNELQDAVTRWSSRFTAQLPQVFVPPPPPPIPAASTEPSSRFIAYEDEVKMNRVLAAQRAKIAAMHAAFAQAQADAAKRDRDQANIKPNILPLLLNLHSIFPPLDDKGHIQAGSKYPFQLALESDQSVSAIKKAFLKASIFAHPDKQSQSDATRKQLAALLFPVLRDSYQDFMSKQ